MCALLNAEHTMLIGAELEITKMLLILFYLNTLLNIKS